MTRNFITRITGIFKHEQKKFKRIKIIPSITITAVRKPLIHCSFLSYIKNGFENSLNYSDSEINLDTVVKINVQNICVMF